MPTVEDFFDDDTDLPLPSSSSSRSRGLPNTGQRGALLEEITSEDEVEDDMDLGKLADQGRGIFGENSIAPERPQAPSSSSSGKGKMTMRQEPGELGRIPGQPPINPNTPMGGFMGDMMKFQEAEAERMELLRKQFGNATLAQDPSVYKAWYSVYPLYFDAKVSIGDGRRIPRKLASWWPQATQISHACRSLGLPSVLEPDKIHPADWENPGRLKVQISVNGRFHNPIIKNRTQLYIHLAEQIRQANPSISFASHPPNKSKSRSSTDSSKSKSNPKSKSKSTSKSSKPSSTKIIPPVLQPSHPPRAPVLPKVDERYPLHSPVIPTGVALSSIKRDLEQEKENKKKGLPAIGGAEEGAKEKQPKMKRVVVRGKR
ncbi:hypothetical protein BCR39DRAFT_548166 [Naematelia encephala]|uniref:Signal recognition particle, SRP19 subunit n=1 Tax=Naematelia encephala TaxID=71784 RepID=A0A1Y2AN67_9TREE|nr:hypothetical protein BCR39DRAFT_548166 [Naematelia encephala]